MGQRTKNFKTWVMSYLTTILLLIAIGIGAALAAILILFARNERYNARNVMYVGFFGELIIRAIQCMSLPLAVTGVTLGVMRLRLWFTLQILIYSMIYIFLTKSMAAVLGINLASMFLPNYYYMRVSDDTHKKVMEMAENITSVDNFLDCIRNLFPANIIAMTFKRYQTVLIPQNKSGNPYMWPVSKYGKMVDGINYFGLMNYSILFGIALMNLPYKTDHVEMLYDTLHMVVKKIAGWLLFISPIFAISVIAGAAMSAEDEGYVYADFGKMLLVVILGQAAQCALIYPMLYYFLVYANPFTVWADCTDAILIGFISGSSWVALPITLNNLLRKTDITPTLIQLVIPFAHIFNKDGATVFISAALVAAFRFRNWSIHLAKMLLFSMLGGTTGIASAEMPYQNILCIMMGVATFDIPFDAPTYMAVDWLVKRTGTIVDIMGDVYLVSIFSVYYTEDFLKSQLRKNA